MRAPLLVVLVLIVSGGPVMAGAPSCRKSNAQRHARRGEGEFLAGRFETALAAFRCAARYEAALGDPAGIRWNVARCLEELRRYEEAIVAFEHYQDIEEDPQRLDEAQAKIDALGQALTGSLIVECGGEGMLIELVGDSVALCPARWDHVPVGERVLVAAVGELRYPPIPVRIEPRRASVVTVPAPGWLSISSAVDGGEARIDRQIVGVVPLKPVTLPPGRYRLELRTPQHTPWSREIEIRSGQTTKIRAEPRPVPTTTPTGVLGEGVPVTTGTGERATWLTWSAGGTATAATGAAILLLWASNASADRLDRAQQDYDDAATRDAAESARERMDSAQQSATTQRYGAYALFGTSAALTTLTAWLLLRSESRVDGGAEIALSLGTRSGSRHGATLSWNYPW